MRSGLKLYALMTLVALLFTAGGALAEELFSHCGDDCCDSGACEECALCLCCSPSSLALPAAGIELATSRSAVLQHCDIDDRRQESRGDLFDPPPRI